MIAVPHSSVLMILLSSIRTHTHARARTRTHARHARTPRTHTRTHASYSYLVHSVTVWCLARACSYWIPPHKVELTYPGVMEIGKHLWHFIESLKVLVTASLKDFGNLPKGLQVWSLHSSHMISWHLLPSTKMYPGLFTSECAVG